MGIAIGFAIWVAPVGAQPGEEIEMDPDPIGSGSAGSGSAGSAATPPEAPVKDPKVAKKHLATAIAAMQKADFFLRSKKAEEAKAQFEAAHVAYLQAIQAGNDVNLYYEVGLIEAKLGKIDEAAKHWRMVIKGAGAKPEVVKKATTKFDDALASLGLVTLTVKPEGASISLNGAEVAKAPLAEPMIFLPGTYLFQISADGFQSKETEVKVEAGSEAEKAIELEETKVIIEKPIVDNEPIDRVTATKPSMMPVFIGGGATLALVATATVTGLLAVGKHGTFTAGDSNANERKDAQSAGKRFAVISDLTTIGAIGAGAFTVYWYLFKYKPAQRKLATEQRGTVTSKMTVVPWVQADTAGGLSLTGSF